MDLDDFLAAQKSSGRVDSEGVFTIALEKARQKLGQFQLDDPSFYLLKVVQAAVQGGATRIDLRTSRKKLALWFDAPTPLFDFPALLEALRQPLEAAPGPLRSLALGFNACLFSEPPQVSLVWWGREISNAVLASEGELAALAAPERPAGVSDADSLYVFSVEKAAPGWFENATAREHATISTYCAYAAVDFRIDGRRLEAGQAASPRPDVWLVGHSEPFHLVQRLTPDPTGRLRVRAPKKIARARGQSGWLRQDRSDEPFCLQPASPRPDDVAGSAFRGEVVCERAYTLPLALTGIDKMILISHGVKVGTVPVNSRGAGAEAIVNADGLSFDLSGFGAVRDLAFVNLVQEVNAVWSEMANSVYEDLDRLTATVIEKERKANEERGKQSLTCGSLSCCFTLLAAASLPLPFLHGDFSWVLALLSLAGGAYAPWLKRPPDPHQRLRDAVRERLQRLREIWPRD